MHRNERNLMDSARKHVVYAQVNGDGFVVESGSSGELYKVTDVGHGVRYSCECVWGLTNPGTECSHILAARLSRNVVSQERTLVITVRGNTVSVV
jgi:hypothetical protein